MYCSNPYADYFDYPNLKSNELASMTTLTGIHGAEYLVQFLGKKIAVREADGSLSIYPLLYSISHNEMANVQDSNGMIRTVHWSNCENPYIIFLHQKVEMK